MIALASRNYLSVWGEQLRLRSAGLSVLFRRHQHRHRCIDAAVPDRHIGELQAHLHARDSAEQREVVDVAEMADPKNPVLENPKAIAEAHVEASQNQRAQSVGAVAFSEAN